VSREKKNRGRPEEKKAIVFFRFAGKERGGGSMRERGMIKFGPGGRGGKRRSSLTQALEERKEQ